jgi:hypothetical protein
MKMLGADADVDDVVAAVQSCPDIQLQALLSEGTRTLLFRSPAI